jgi:MFS family permease
MLVITYGLCLGFGTSMIYSCTISNSVKFFPDRRGLAGGLATASYGISSVIVPPIANALITIFGVTATFKILGATMFLIIYAASFFIRQSPPVLTPEGRRPAASAVKNNADKNWKGILADPVFYVMLLLLCCGAFSGLMVISQASLIAQGMIGMSAATSAAAVSALALFNTCGRIAAGAVSDKLGVVRTLAGIFIVSIIGLIILLMIGTGDVIQFYAGVLFVGFAFGSIMGMFPGFTAQQFGYRNNSVNYGIMFTGFAASGFFGPTIMSAVYTQTGSYKPAFLTAICLAAAGMLLSIVYAVSAASRRRNITG